MEQPDPETRPAPPLVVADVASMSDAEIEIFTDEFIAGMIRRADERDNTAA